MFNYKSIVTGEGGITAKVVAKSVYDGGPELTTLELRYHRFIHSEFMTHRMFSRNASSNRAIPTRKLVAQVREDPAIPIKWGRNQRGMQAREDLDVGAADGARNVWVAAARAAADRAESMAGLQVHKQIVNRVLEPFQFITVVVTATEWDNFFKLRLHEDAQPEIYELACVMKEAMDSAEADEVEMSTGWHLPYVDVSSLGYDLPTARRCSVARLARVSYLNHDATEPNIDVDVAFHDRLLNDGHMSPFEHVATPVGVPNPGFYRNLRGWVPYRLFVEDS